MRVRTLLLTFFFATVFLAGNPAEATDTPITVGEVSAPLSSAGVDLAAVRDAAEGEIKRIDASRLPNRRRFVVSFALNGMAAEDPVVCNVSAMLRDAKTGTMIAIIETGVQAGGPVSAELRKQLAHAAVRGAVRRIPTALGAK